MRKPLIAGNWKMNMDVEESINLVRDLGPCPPDENVDVVICPPFTSLYGILTEVKGSYLKIGAQNMHFEDKGAYTGEISPSMLKKMGVEYVILGHSERRQHFGERDEIINKKVKAALSYGLKPILCLGESLEQREEGLEKETVKNQLIKDLENIEIDDGKKIVIAYEPVWAIGTGKTATSAQANEMCSYIREILAEIFNPEIANDIIIQYGGSVNPSNVKDIMIQSDIDGALVGGSSLKAKEFIKIINFKEQKG